MQIKNGYYVWNKGDPRALIGKNFSTREFECKCSHKECGEQRISADLVHRLDDVRDELGAPIWVNSGFRCKQHQKDLTTDATVQTVPVSTHEKGDAADIGTRRMTPMVPILKKHFKAIGLARTWAHVDLRGDKVRSWSYK